MRGIDRIFPGPAAASSVERMNLADPDLKPEIEALSVNDLRYRPEESREGGEGRTFDFPGSFAPFVAFARPFENLPLSLEIVS
jgi:hypothetical protein